jgi:hypothetical protein
MAIIWKFNINQVGNGNNYNISATVTDDTKPVDFQEESVSLQGKFETPEEKAKVYGWLKDQYEEKVAKTEAKAALELKAKNAAEALCAKG